jgi:GNAT superfamily N-acetyltransferase
LTELQVGWFGPADQDAARALILDGMVEHWGSLDPALNRDLDDIATSYVDALFLVGRVDGRVVATGALHPDAPIVGEGLVTRMAVAGDLRRLGLGRRLLDRLAAEARARGLHRLVLETTTDWDDVVAFYLGCGFAVTHLEHGRWSSNTWFALDL